MAECDADENYHLKVRGHVSHSEKGGVSTPGCEIVSQGLVHGRGEIEARD